MQTYNVTSLVVISFLNTSFPLYPVTDPPYKHM